ncbi:hypothetical protein [Nonomuraea dietziae]
MTVLGGRARDEATVRAGRRAGRPPPDLPVALTAYLFRDPLVIERAL